MVNGICLYSCPGTIWLQNGATAANLATDSPVFASPNGSPHCLYVMQGGDRHSGVFDRVVGKAVDWFPLFQEYKDAAGSWRLRANGWVPVYSNNLSVQGTQCSNRPGDFKEYGYIPGTCYGGGDGNFDKMCMIDTDPNSPLGVAARAKNLTRVVGGGQWNWGNFQNRYNNTFDGNFDGTPY
jgi:hypothetical protein